MLPSSVRRVVSSASQPQLLSCLSSATPRAAAVALSRGHQRRCSSSKPSSSDNGSKDFPTGQSVHASSGSSRSQTKSGSEKRRRKGKDSDGKEASLKKQLPSVPSTQHLSQEALALSTFFSMHRPISVTHSLPKTVTDDAFAAIFKSRSRASKISEVISTISKTVEDIEGPMAKMTISSKQEEADANWEPVHKIDVKYPDGTESSVYVQLNAMGGQFLPFRPPPSPEPQPADQAEANAQAEAEAATEAIAEESAEEPVEQHRVYRAMFTIEEVTDSDGEVRVLAHSPRILPNERPRRFLERMALRHMRQEGEAMHVISVRRQRKLKMKKKKYKKLMKRTRTLRRKLNQI